MEFVETLKEKYGVDKPIFFREISETKNGYSKERIYQLINEALKKAS